MSSNDSGSKGAADLFRAAFQRLVNGEARHLPPDAPVTLTNVAKEAGRSPSALRVDRYPDLMREIKDRMRLDEETEKLGRSGKTAGNSRNRTLKKRLDDCMRQRDRLLSICHSQQTLIEELQDDIRQLEQGKQPLRFPERRGDKS